MSDVEKYWNAIAAKAGDSRKWGDLPLQLQHLVIQSINQLLVVLNTNNP